MIESEARVPQPVGCAETRTGIARSRVRRISYWFGVNLIYHCRRGFLEYADIWRSGILGQLQ